VLDRYREKWHKWGIGPQTAANYIVRLRKLGKFLVSREWWKKNYALDLEYPEDFEHTERQPFTDEEMTAILEAARTVKVNHQQEACATAAWQSLMHPCCRIERSLVINRSITERKPGGINTGLRSCFHYRSFCLSD